MTRSKFLFSFLMLSFLLFSCKKDKKDLNTYGLNEIELLPPSAGKNKLKTNEQYVAILYANLFQKGMSANQLYDISECMESIGDKELAREVLISNFLNKPGVLIPSDSSMRSDVGKFIDETYKRFLVRLPTQAEKTYMVNFITADPNVTPELVYFSFALSNEYMYY